MGVSLDLRKAHKSNVRGDIVVVLTWVNDSRALVLIPTVRRDAGWYILDESASYLWNINAIDPVERRACLAHADQQAQIACTMMGIEPNLRNRARIINLITDALPELISMPSGPVPEYLKGAVGQMILRADGEVVAGEDIKLQEEGTLYA